MSESANEALGKGVGSPSEENEPVTTDGTDVGTPADDGGDDGSNTTDGKGIS